MLTERVPPYLEICDSNRNTIALLSPEADGVKEVRINQELNSSCTLTFWIPYESINPQIGSENTIKGISSVVSLNLQNKNNYFVPDNIVIAGNKEFVFVSPDAKERVRDGKKKYETITIHESWILLGKKYSTISNDPQRTNPPWGTVSIISGGSDLSGGRYSVGTAAHALYALLQGTGWTMGIVDVAGVHDLETEKESVLSNINAILDKWGGNLFWDSINRTVSLRSEETYQPYTGYQVRYEKNLKNITRSDDYDVITRLYPFGEKDLNIAAVNSGKLYIENFSYTSQVLEGIWQNQDIIDQNELKSEGIKQLNKLCRPRHNYQIGHLDLRSLPEYAHEFFDIGYMVDIVDYDLEINTRARIIKLDYNVFQPWQCDLEVGDPLESIAGTIANSVVAAQKINSILPNASFQDLLKGYINTLGTEINGAKGDYSLIDGVATWIERDQSGNPTGNLVRITPQGIIISSDGGQTWDLAINGSSINASMIRSGQIEAGMITVGAGTFYEPGYNPSEKETPSGAQNKANAAQNNAQAYAANAANTAQSQAETYAANAANTAQNNATWYAYTQVEAHNALNSPHNLPSYTQLTSTGVLVYDALNALRVHLGQYTPGRYGLKVVGGEIFSSLVRSGGEFDSEFIQFYPPNKLEVWAGGRLAVELRTNSFYQRGELIFRNSVGYLIASVYLNDYEQLYLYASNGLQLGSPETVASGDFRVMGTKNAIQETINYGNRAVNAVESAEILYYDRGVAYLENGEATVYLDPIFLECIEPDTELTPWTFWTESYGENDVYVYEWGENYFKVKERNDGQNNSKFAWKFEATRGGYAGTRLMEVFL